MGIPDNRFWIPVREIFSGNRPVDNSARNERLFGFPIVIRHNTTRPTRQLREISENKKQRRRPATEFNRTTGYLQNAFHFLLVIVQAHFQSFDRVRQLSSVR